LRVAAQSTMMAPMASPKKNLYEILGVPRDANALDIGLALRARTAEQQRAVPQDPSAQSLLHQAHEILANPQRRAAYDASLVTAAEKAAASEQAEPDLILESGEEEADPRKKFVKPGIAVVVVIVLAIFFAMRSGHAPEAPKPEPVAEAPKPPPPPPPTPLSSGQILTSVRASVGPVMSYEMSGRAVPVGLALVLEPGVVVTTCHGISGGSQLVVKIAQESLSGSLTVTDEVLDLCRVSVPGLTARAVVLSADDARVSDKIYVLGANAKSDLALTEGSVSQLRSTPEGKVLEISVPVAPAGSGGAVFDVFGRVIGIATTPHAYGANLNIAIPASAIAQMRSRERPAAK
jgi:serine protease Do